MVVEIMLINLATFFTICTSCLLSIGELANGHGANPFIESIRYNGFSRDYSIYLQKGGKYWRYTCMREAIANLPNLPLKEFKFTTINHRLFHALEANFGNLNIIITMPTCHKRFSYFEYLDKMSKHGFSLYEFVDFFEQGAEFELSTFGATSLNVRVDPFKIDRSLKSDEIGNQLAEAVLGSALCPQEYREAHPNTLKAILLYSILQSSLANPTLNVVFGAVAITFNSSGAFPGAFGDTIVNLDFYTSHCLLTRGTLSINNGKTLSWSTTSISIPDFVNALSVLGPVENIKIIYKDPPIKYKGPPIKSRTEKPYSRDGLVNLLLANPDLDPPLRDEPDDDIPQQTFQASNDNFTISFHNSLSPRAKVCLPPEANDPESLAKALLRYVLSVSSIMNPGNTFCMI